MTRHETIVLPPRAAAVRIGVSDTTLRRLRLSGRLDAVKLSDRRIAYRITDLDAFIDANRDTTRTV